MRMFQHSLAKDDKVPYKTRCFITEQGQEPDKWKGADI